MKKHHHPFCNYFNTPIIRCKQCKYLYKKFPINKGESIKDAKERILKNNFPNITIKTNEIINK